jgi:hypothetical protein
MRYAGLCVLLVLLFSACDKRYEDGPCVSFFKAENRVCGRWKVGQFLKDQADGLTVAQKDTLDAYSFSVFRNLDQALFISVIDSSETVVAESLIRHDDRLTQLTFGLASIAGYETVFQVLGRIIPALGAEYTWRINRLKRNEFWMNTTEGGSRSEIRFSLLYDYQNT